MMFKVPTRAQRATEGVVEMRRTAEGEYSPGVPMDAAPNSASSYPGWSEVSRVEVGGSPPPP